MRIELDEVRLALSRSHKANRGWNGSAIDPRTLTDELNKVLEGRGKCQSTVSTKRSSARARIVGVGLKPGPKVTVIKYQGGQLCVDVCLVKKLVRPHLAQGSAGMIAHGPMELLPGLQLPDMAVPDKPVEEPPLQQSIRE